MAADISLKKIANRVAIIQSLTSTKFRAGQLGALIQIEGEFYQFKIVLPDQCHTPQ